MSSGKKVKRKLRGWALRRIPLMMTCEELERFVVDYVDENLPLSERTRFELHLRICAPCQIYINNYKQTIAISQAAFDESHSSCDDMPEDLVRAILEARNRS